MRNSAAGVQTHPTPGIISETSAVAVMIQAISPGCGRKLSALRAFRRFSLRKHHHHHHHQIREQRAGHTQADHRGLAERDSPGTRGSRRTRGGPPLSCPYRCTQSWAPRAALRDHRCQAYWAISKRPARRSIPGGDEGGESARTRRIPLPVACCTGRRLLVRRAGGRVEHRPCARNRTSTQGQQCRQPSGGYCLHVSRVGDFAWYRNAASLGGIGGWESRLRR